MLFPTYKTLSKYDIFDEIQQLSDPATWYSQ